MSNSMIIEEVLKDADMPLSGDQVWLRAKKENPSINRCTVSTILNKMLDRDKVCFDREQIGIRRIKFWKLHN